MQFIKDKEKVSLVLNKKDAIFDIAINCWCVKNRFYDKPNETTTEITFNQFLERKIFDILIRDLIEQSRQDKANTHAYRIYIAWLLLYQMQHDLDPRNQKDVTKFETLQLNLKTKNSVKIPPNFEFSQLPDYKKKRAEKIICDYILFDLVRAEKNILHPSAIEKESIAGSIFKSVSHRGSQIKRGGSQILEAGKNIARSRSGSQIKSDSPPRNLDWRYLHQPFPICLSLQTMMHMMVIQREKVKHVL